MMTYALFGVLAVVIVAYIFYRRSMVLHKRPHKPKERSYIFKI